MRLSTLNRKLHRWGAILTSLPLLVIIVTGFFLQLKKESDWIQPPTQQGTGTEPTVSFDRVLESAKTVPEAEIQGWDDIERLDVRPSKGVVKVRAKNSWEIQVDTETGDVLQVAKRRSDLIEDIHDGSFFHDKAKLYIFLPTGVVLFGLWVTGIYLFLLPYLNRRKRNNKKA